MATFRLDADFVASYASRPVPFGFHGLGRLVYERTYARKKPDGSAEQWHETIERVVNGCYNMQRRWILMNGLGWRNDKAQRSAQEMFDRAWSMKFLPPGRGLWAMGSPMTEERGLFAALSNCAFVSTATIDKGEPSKPFTFLMDMSMLGVGVGFDTKGAGQIVVHGPLTPGADHPVFLIPDSREGWVESLKLVVEGYLVPNSMVPYMDYSLIRPYGALIEGFGGLASGPDPLKDLHASVTEVLQANSGSPITVTTIVDIMNLIGRCVVAGNVRCVVAQSD